MQKGFTALLLLLGVVVVGGIVAFYFYFSNTLSKSTSLKPPAQKENIQIYQNDKLGFQFQYSDEDLKVQEDSEEEFNKRGNGEFRKNFTYYITYSPPEMIGGVVVLDETASFETNLLTVWVFDNPNNLTIDKWYERYWYYPFVWGDYTERRNNVAPKNDATISGKLAKYGMVTYRPGSPKFFYLSHGGNMYLFKAVGEGGEKILQTVKFVEKMGGCFVAGCSGQLCVEEEEKDIITTCEFREEYACYKDARCERQPDGKCGWTKTEQLIQCLGEKRNSSSNTVF